MEKKRHCRSSRADDNDSRLGASDRLNDADVATAWKVCGAAVVQVRTAATVAMSDLNVNNFFSLEGKVALVTGGKSPMLHMLSVSKTAH